LAGAELELLTWLSLLPLTLVPLGVASSLLEFRLWDLEDVLRQVIATGTTVLLGGVAFALFNLWLTQVGTALGSLRNLLAAAAGVALVGLALPLRRALLTAVERWQYRERLAARQALATFAEQAVGISDPQVLLTRLGELLRQALAVDQVVLYRREGDQLVCAYPGPHLPSLSPAALQGPFPSGEEATLKSLGLWHRFPIVRGQRLLGVAYLGRKEGAMPLPHAERRLVGALVAQAALALENSLLLADLVRQVEQHRLLEEYLERVFASAATALLICDAHGTVLRANQRALSLLAGEEGSLAGKNLASLITLPPSWGQTLPERAAGVQVPLVGTGERVGLLSVSTIELQPGQRDGRVVAVEDITQQLELEHRLAQQERMAALGRLAAGLAHEVNTPVTGIASYAQLLRDLTPAHDPRASLAEKIEEQAFRVARIVTNLLELARPAGFQRQIVDLAAVAREVWVSLRAEAKRAGVDFTCHGPDTLPILANRVQMELVVHNLLRNALQATPPQGQVEVRVWEENGRALLEVRDTGPGIPEELRSQVFEPFVTTRAGQGGTGLGLAITRDIVEAHGGSITVLAGSPTGTVMRVEMPKEGSNYADSHH
jgi:signal transduction histidine kinase